MSFSSMLSTLIIGPLKLLFEFIFSQSNRVLSPGFSIIVLSLIVNFLVLPLYKRADAMQEEERKTEERLAYWVNHIKHAFKGDQRYMILQEYYRQNNYSPLHALKGALPLLLQIPFFIAAYQFLSGLQLLQGTPFGPIRDLGAPDALLKINNYSINLLPILITIVNVLSGSIYSKNAPLKSKIQLWLMAFVFLFLLYPSPAGLTMYWTLNNLFSLVKNLLARNRHKRLVLSIASSLAGLFVFVLAISFESAAHWRIAVLLVALLLQLPLVLSLMIKHRFVKQPALIKRKVNTPLFFTAASLIALLTGLLIPSSVLVASPSEFIDHQTLLNPLWFVVSSLLYAAGTFVLWFGIYYLLAKPSVKKILEIGLWILAGFMLLNYMVFKYDFGSISNILQYEIVPVFTARQKLINLLALFVLALLFAILYAKKESFVRTACLTGALVIAGMGGYNVFKSRAVIQKARETIASNAQEKVSIPLSTEGKNVIIIMLDRGISAHVPVIFHEKPELAAKFEGFTWYPNTLSHGAYTNFGAPGLFGGYEYTPSAMNARSDELLKDKHNEALLVLPTLFSKEGYTITVCDPPYAGDYEMIPNLKMYQDLESTHAFITSGAFMTSGSSEGQTHLRFRNFFPYALCETAPTVIFGLLYNVGFYNEPDLIPKDQVRNGFSRATGTGLGFSLGYSVLSNLSSISEIRNGDGNTLLLFANNATHDPTLLAEPDYTPEIIIDNTQYDQTHADRFNAGPVPLKMENDYQMIHYHANMAAMIQIGNWLDFMKENGVYDNTRIIIVSDHGRNLEQIEGFTLPGTEEDGMFYNALLMVKDFNRQGSVKTDFQFMTNADVPSLATQSIIDHPINPFTGKEIDGEEAKALPQEVTISHEWSVSENSGKTYLPAEWFAVRENIFNLKNWTPLGVH